MLSFVPGDVPRNPLPPETAADDVLAALARLIRALHEASAGWVPPADAVWGGTPANLGRPATRPAELVSHCDYYPGNVVFRDGRPAALIDFDLAHPTTRRAGPGVPQAMGGRCQGRAAARRSVAAQGSAGDHRPAYITASWPPSMTSPVPWMNEASSEARNA